MTSASSKSSHALEARSLKAWKASYMRKVETGVSIALPKRNTRIVVGQLKSTQFGRECKSRRVHQLSLKAAMMELAYILLSKRRFCGFNSHWRYHLHICVAVPERIMELISNQLNAGSSPVSDANLPCSSRLWILSEVSSLFWQFFWLTFSRFLI